MASREGGLRRKARSVSPREMGFGQLYEDIGDAVIVADAHTGNVVMANPAAERMFGYGTDELVGKPVEVLMPPRFRQAHRQGLGSFQATGRGRMIDGHQPVDLVGLRRDGTEFELEMTVTAVRAASINGRFVVAVIRDCSERKAAEARWRALVDHAPDLVLTTDVTGKLDFVNHKAQALATGPVLGRSIFEVAGEVTEARLRPAFEQVARTHQATSFGARGARGGYYHVRVGPIRVAGWLSGFMVIAMDVTAEKASDEAIRDLARRLEDAQRLSHVGSWEWEVGPDRLTWSAELYRIYGVDPARFGGTVQDFLAAIHPDDRAAVQASVEAALASPRPFAFEHRLVRPSGELRSVHCLGEVLTDARGRPTRLLGTCQDVTELRAAARAVAERDAALRQERDLARERTAFMNAIAHDLQNPLTTIMGYAEFLDEAALAPELQGYVEELSRAARRMQGLIADLLDAARLEAGAIAPTLAAADMATIVREVVSAMQPPAKAAGVALVRDLPAGPLRLRTDARRVGQVIGNLLSNALKFTPAGGEVRVRARHTAQGVRVEVRDTGVGIRAADQPRLFQPFTQLEAGRRRGGTGLGLGISRSIVEALGGQIGVTSEPGHGATFWFTLPDA